MWFKQVSHICIVLTAASFRDMVGHTYSGMKADEQSLIIGYTTAFPDDGAEGDFLLDEYIYAANWTSLAKLLVYLREALNANESLRPQERHAGQEC